MYSNENCFACKGAKKLIKDKNINIEVRDINLHENEYKQIVELTNSDYVPLFTVIDFDINKGIAEPKFLKAYRDYDDVKEAIEKIEEMLK